MPCQQCGMLTYHPGYHWATKQVLGFDCYPFVCSNCGVTQRQFSVEMDDGRELCQDGFMRWASREDRTFGVPTDGTLFKESL